MRRWIGGCLLAVLAACLFGCSATGPRFSEMAQSLPSLGENEGRIYFYRNSILGAAVQPEVSVNGQVVGKSQPNSFFFIDRPPGTYRATARTEAEGSIDIVLRPRQTAYVQMSISMGFLVGHPAFERVGETEGRKALPPLAYGGMAPVSARVAGAAAPAASATASPPAPQPIAGSTTPPAPSAATASSPQARPVVAAQPMAAQAAAPVAPAAVASASAPAPATAPVPVQAATDASPFAKTQVNDLRLLLQTSR